MHKSKTRGFFALREPNVLRAVFKASPPCRKNSNSLTRIGPTASGALDLWQQLHTPCHPPGELIVPTRKFQ